MSSQKRLRINPKATLFILTEDSEAGYHFWCAVASIARIPVQVESSRGCINMRQAFSELPLQTGDTLYLVIDKVGNTSFDDIIYIVTNCSTPQCNVKVITANFYCFEELMLSYLGWEKRCCYTPVVKRCCPNVWCVSNMKAGCHRCQLAQFVKNLQAKIWGVPTTNYQQAVQLRKQRGHVDPLPYDLGTTLGYAQVKHQLKLCGQDGKVITKEAQLKRILSRYTVNSRGYRACYSVTTRGISECWLKSCSECEYLHTYNKYKMGYRPIDKATQRQVNKAIGRVKTCSDDRNRDNLREKLLEFNDKSLLQFSLNLHKIL